ncbi:hypothetical protein NC653_039248 [Populus alba x Populus x berolinensis]|uniref:Uncharacterized protein n=1 Tax=Populus alba x Populus x berolinensis TaxID=444605 RepID=A0AAD6LAS7_9ROSI|nr:hypothetical protein NC653_039248 [Populus alba x Populus x berolinensis]
MQWLMNKDRKTRNVLGLNSNSISSLSKPKKKTMQRKKLHKEGIFPCFGMRETVWASDYEKIFPHDAQNMFFPKERSKQERENTIFFLLLSIPSLSFLPYSAPIHGKSKVCISRNFSMTRHSRKTQNM